MRNVFSAVISMVLAAPAVADGLSIYDSQTGKYLGDLSSDRYDPDSVSNPYGQYGSRYSPDSINNPYGQYGSPYSPDSARNPYATNPPVVIDQNDSGYDSFNIFD